MKLLPEDMIACIEICSRCANTCLTTAMTYCLKQGGAHTDPRHFSLMIACAEICRACAAVMMTGISAHRQVCVACSEICAACAQSCAEIGGMEECAAVCRECAESCRSMSDTPARAA